MSNIKVAILEKDGIEYDIPVEYILKAEDIPEYEDEVISSEIRTIKNKIHHVYMNNFTIHGSGDLIIDGELGVI